MGLFFVHYQKISIGLLFQDRVNVDFPTELTRHDDPILEIKEDSNGHLRIETEKNVYQQDGYREDLNAAN